MGAIQGGQRAMISTWISEHEVPNLSKVDDKELDELFQEVRKVFNNGFLIQTTKYDNRTWWDLPTENYLKTGTLYTLYHMDKFPDAQVINFPPIEGSRSINTSVTKGQLMTYFFGLLAGKQ
jgi:hypothetical protein